MDEEQILELAQEHLDAFPDDYNATREQLIAFARAIYEIGYEVGNENGWDSREQAEYLNSSYPLFCGDDE